MSELIINSEESLEAYINHLRSEYEKHKYLRMSHKTGKQRTLTQNAALHKYFELVAEKLNDSGQDMRKVLKQEVEIPWTQSSVKEFMWKPIQKVMLGKESTAMAMKDEYSKVYEIMSAHLSSKTGVFVEFPSREVS